MTVPDLKPNSQDISAFYLGTIYEVLADPNTTRASIPSPVAQPPPFSPPRYAIWVNSLWFLSFVISLTCALLATSLHQWSNRYLMVTQSAWPSPEKRARIRAFYALGAEQMHISWVVEALPMLLHLRVPLLWRTRHFSFPCRPHYFQLCDVVDRAFLNRVCINHSDANCSAQQPILCAAV